MNIHDTSVSQHTLMKFLHSSLHCVGYRELRLPNVPEKWIATWGARVFWDGDVVCCVCVSLFVPGGRDVSVSSPPDFFFVSKLERAWKMDAFSEEIEYPLN